MMPVVGTVWDDKISQLASDVNAWQAQVNAAGGNAKIDTSQIKSQAGSDAFKSMVTALQAAGQSATMAAQNATNVSNQISMMNLPSVQAPSTSPNAVTSVAQLQQLSQAAQTAGQQASSLAGTGSAMPVGSDATDWMAQAQKALDAANAAAQAANQGAQQLQLVAQLSQQTSAASASSAGAGGGGSGGGGSGGGGGGGGGIDESQVDWGDDQGGGGGDGGGGDGYAAAQQMMDDATAQAPQAPYDMDQGAFDAGAYPFPQDLDFSDLQGIFGAQLIGMVDIGEKQRQMNQLKTVPLSVARALLKGGQQAIDRARSLASEHGLPGGTARDNVFWKLKWHEDALSRETGSNAALYAPGEDLKKWVMEAFIEGNAAEEGAYQESLIWGKVWSEMWDDIASAIAALPAAIKKVVQSAENVADSAATTAKWTGGLLLGGTVILGLGLIYGLYKVIVSDTGKEIARTATGVALGRRY